MDYVIGLPESDGYNAILTIVDRLTKERHYVPCIAAEEGTSAEATAGILIREVFRIHGLSAFIVSDRGPQFVAIVWKAFCKRLQIQAKLFTAFHPETDGQCHIEHGASGRFSRISLLPPTDHHINY